MSQADVRVTPLLGPAQSAMISSRRWTVAIFAIVGITLQIIVVVTQRIHVTPIQWVLFAIAILTLVVGVLRGTGRYSLSLLAFGSWLLVVMNFFAADDADPWLLINNDALFGIFAIAVIARPAFFWLAVIVLPFVLRLAWMSHPKQVIASGFQIWDGWIPSIQVAVVGITVYYVWRALQRESRLRDERILENRMSMHRALETQARGRVWHDAAVRIHESLLNEIRYVLAVAHVDGPRLRTIIEEMNAWEIENAPTPRMNLRELIDSVSHTNDLESRVRVALWVSDVELPGETWLALRAATIEACRNLLRHTDAHEVRLDARREGSTLVIEVSGPGQPTRSRAPQGVGSALVITESLRTLGGDVAFLENTEGVRMWIPVEFADEVPEPTTQKFLSSLRARGDLDGDSAFARSRVLMTTLIGAMAGSGFLYFIALGPGLSANAALGVVTMLVGIIAVAIAYVIPLGRIRIPPAFAVLLYLPSLAFLVLALAGDHSCAEALPLASAVNLTGFAVVVVGIWSRIWVLALGLVVWVTLTINLINDVPATCTNLNYFPIINTLFIMPIAALAILIAWRYNDRAQRMAEEVAARSDLERARAMAASEINERLRELVRRALELLVEASTMDTLEPRLRRLLQVVEGRIRIAVQVDPQVSGAFALLAQDLVDRAAEREIPIDVRLIEASRSVEPLEPAVVDFIIEILADSWPELATLSVFSDDDDDYLTLTARVTALHDVESLHRFGTATVEIDRAQEEMGVESGAAIIVSRLNN